VNASESEFEPTADPVAVLHAAAEGSRALDAQVALEAEQLARQRQEGAASDSAAD
jgi:hypothetical protein